MLRRIHIFIVCLYLLPYSAKGQEEVNYKDMFLEAESYFLFEEYREALPLYTKLVTEFPDNYNFHYRTGICYLNISYRKSNSIEHLEKAVQNITSDYKEGSFKETKAPLEAYYYLANAYRINNQLEKAIETYKTFKKLLDENVYNSELVDEQIQATENAIKLEKRPIDYNFENLGDRINSRFADVRPVVSGNESAIAYVSELQFYDAVFYSEKVDGEWSYPRNLIPEFGVDGDVYTTCLSYDGNEMYLYRSDNFIGNLYVSKKVDGVWSPIKKLNENINTKYWESHASLSQDGNTLYFSSNRKGGYGGLDIYQSKRQPNGEWGPAENLGSTINTKYNDDTPFITEDNTLYFSSYGHYSMGGYDIFYSSKLGEGRWSVPVNLGYPINTTDDDMFFQPVQNGMYAYYSFYRPNNFGRHDIYRLEIFSDQHPRKYEVKGLLSIKDLAKPTKSFKVILLDKSKKDTTYIAYTDEDGNFKLLVPAGNYKIIIDDPGYESLEQDLVISKKNQNQEISTELIPITKKPDVTALLRDTVQNIKINKKYYQVSDDDELIIKLQLEDGVKLIVESYNSNKLSNTEEFNNPQERFNYPFKPLPGRNILVFKLIDINNNISIEKVTVDYTPKDGKEIIPLDSNLMDFYNQLFQLAEGDLKQVLKDLDLENSDIRTIDELIEYLIEQAKFNNYTEDDVKDLVRKLNELRELQEFLKKLIILADGELKSVLMKVDLVAMDLKTPYQLIEYVSNESISHAYTKEDVYKLILDLANMNLNDTESLINKLIANASDSIAQVLIPIKDKNISTTEDLAHELAQLIEMGNISEKDLIELLLEVALETDQDVHELLSLIKALSIGNLKGYADQLDLELQNIHSSSALIEHLKEQAPIRNYTSKELMAILTTISYKGQLDNYLATIAQLAEGNLKKMLEKYSLEENKITSAASLMIDLKNKAIEGNYTEKDVVDLMMKYYDNISTEDFLNILILLSDDELKAFLKTINLRADQITSISELIDFLEEKAKSNAYSFKDLIDLLIKALPDDDLQSFIDLLVKYANKDLKKFIKEIDLDKENIHSITDLFHYLLEAAADNKFTEQDVMRLFLDVLKYLLDPSAHADQPGGNRAILKYSLGVLALLVILIIIFANRRKKKNSLNEE
ncbi:MAG: PD40 domain-containing protein [Bacteroidales bacterium]|nr:PD40 domain-containing protein [Bacteroidales bacterium]